MAGRKTKEGRFVAVFFAVFILGFHLLNSYSKLFDTRGAFLYDPQNGDLYSVQMAPMRSEHYKWRVFLPFASVKYTEPVYGDRLGNLNELLEISARDNQLYEDDPDAWHEAMEKRIEDLDAITAPAGEVEFWDIAIFYRATKSQPVRIPESLRSALEGNPSQDDMRPVGAVVSSSTLRLDSMSESSPPTITVIRNGTLLQGSAANILVDAIGHY